MAIAPRASASNAQTSFTNTTLAIPASGAGGTVIPGDVAYAVVQINSVKTVTAPSGWVLLSQSTTANPYAALYRKTLGSADIGHNATWSWTGSDFCEAAAAIYSGVDPFTPEAATTVLTEHTVGSTTSIVCPSIVTAMDGCELLAVGVNNANVTVWTAPAGYATRQSNTRMAICDLAQGTAGTAAAATITTNASALWKAFTVAVAPNNTNAEILSGGFFAAI